MQIEPFLHDSIRPTKVHRPWRGADSGSGDPLTRLLHCRFPVAEWLWLSVLVLGSHELHGQAHHTDSNGLLVDEDAFGMMGIEADRPHLFPSPPRSLLPSCKSSKGGLLVG